MTNKTFIVEFKNHSGRIIDTQVVTAVISDIAIALAEQLTNCDWSKVSVRQIAKVAPATTETTFKEVNPIISSQQFITKAGA